MHEFNNVKEIVPTNKSTVVVFTRGDFLKLNKDGTGESGNWVVSAKKLASIKKVVIYYREVITPAIANFINHIYIADYSGKHPSGIPRRWILELTNVQEIGETDSNWMDFANGSQNPVAFI